MAHVTKVKIGDFLIDTDDTTVNFSSNNEKNNNFNNSVKAPDFILDIEPEQISLRDHVLEAIDHGNLTGLDDDDHTQYALVTGRNTSESTAHIGSTANPHSVTIDQLTPTTTKGDLLVENGTNVVRIPVGTDGQVLEARSTESSGVRWTDSSMNSIRKFAGLSNGSVINIGDGFVSLLPSTLIGSNIFAAGSWTAGDTYHFLLAGQCDFVKSTWLTIQVLTGTNVMATFQMDLETTDNPDVNWEVECDLQLRAVGTSVEMVINAEFSYNKKITKDWRGMRVATVYNTFDTTVSNTIDIQASLVNGSGSTLVTYLGVCHKTF